MFDVRAVITRRRLLAVGLGAGITVVGGSAWGLLRHQPAAKKLRVLSDDEAAVVAAVADAYFPVDNALGRAAKDTDVVAVADAYVAGLLPRERRGLRALLRGLDAWPRLAMYGGTFQALSVADRQSVLQAFDDSGVDERRLLGAVIRTVCLMGYFEDEATLLAIGHRHGCGLPIYDDVDAGIG
jgi:hypothetical protein